MNFTGLSASTRVFCIGSALLVTAFFAAPTAPAQEAKAGATAAKSSAATAKASTNATTAAATATQEKKPQADTPAAVSNPVVKELLKLADAGVSKEVMKGYLDGSSFVYEPNASDLITLKQRGVTDDVTSALLKRALDTRKQATSARNSPAMPAIVRDSTTGGQLDPEGYDFWWFHYAYPRALSYSYKTLAPYQPHYPGGSGRNRNPWSRYPEKSPRDRP